MFNSGEERDGKRKVRYTCRIRRVRRERKKERRAREACWIELIAVSSCWQCDNQARALHRAELSSLAFITDLSLLHTSPDGVQSHTFMLSHIKPTKMIPFTAFRSTSNTPTIMKPALRTPAPPREHNNH